MSQNPSSSRAATLLLRLLISTNKSSRLPHRLRWKALLIARQIILRFKDPTVEYEFRGSRLLIPLSHDLPLIDWGFPNYSENLGRVAAHLSEKYGAFPIIDIGANIGDSATIIDRHGPHPVLCIEGEPKFAELLAANVASQQPKRTIEPCFVGTGLEAFETVVHDGTARLTQAQPGRAAAVRTKSFEQILMEHDEFRNSRLVKVDTDGMDVAILNSAFHWISQQRPVLFFEYYPDLQREHDSGGLETLRNLKIAGYRLVLIYDNVGDFMFSAELENEKLLTEMHEFFSGRHSKTYCDLCIFHACDTDIAEKIRRSEMDFFRAARVYSGCAFAD
jgi:FkbM family methyltransferase